MKAYANIYANELKEKMDRTHDVIILDVRTAQEYNRNHIKGAYLIPLDELSLRYSELDPKKDIVVLCSTGRRSIEASRFLIHKGFIKVYNLIGGMALWPYTDIVKPQD